MAIINLENPEDYLSRQPTATEFAKLIVAELRIVGAVAGVSLGVSARQEDIVHAITGAVCEKSP